MDKIAVSRNNVEAAKGELRAAVCEQVIAIRSQKGEVAALEKLIRVFSARSQSAQIEVQVFRDTYERKLKRILNCEEQGVQFVLQTSSSATSNLASSAESFPISGINVASMWVVIQTYSEPSGKDNRQEWKNNWSTFWHLHQQSRCDQDLANDSTVPDVRFVVQENQDGEGTCKTRVSVFRDGDVVSEDAASLMLGDPQPKKLHRNLVYTSTPHEVKSKAPNARTPLQTYCAFPACNYGFVFQTCYQRLGL
ncbi:hypothetical protein L7F22_068467 [Adiantum nelumboides]|nr:hypothetical protein [Adiantum nelumboides]